MDIKEIVNLLYTAIDLAADGGPAAFTDEEYSEMHELLKKIKSGQFGWHPASELPKHSGTYIVIGKLSKLPFYATNDLDGKWCIKSSTSVQREFIDIDWWCYPPKNN